EDFVPSLEHSRTVISHWEGDRLAGKRFALAVRDADTGELLGGGEVVPPSREGANLSYWTFPLHRSRRGSSRAVALACRVAFEHFHFGRLEVLTDPDNIGSRRVAIRNGFEEIGVRSGRILHVRESVAELASN